jgi:hypothetical protein
LVAASATSDRLTPPSSPRMLKERPELSSNYDPVDLQLDYWALASASSEVGGASSSSKHQCHCHCHCKGSGDFLFPWTQKLSPASGGYLFATTVCLHLSGSKSCGCLIRQI